MIGRRSRAPWLVLAVCLAIGGGRAQPRDRQAATTERSADLPTGRVSGVVTLSATGDEPVHTAVVSLIPTEGGDGISTVTDDEGRFAIEGVPAGRYSLVAQKPAYLTSYYGAKRPGRAGVAIVIATGHVVDGLRIVMPKGAVITGRLLPTSVVAVRNVHMLAIPLSQIAAGGQFDTRARAFYSDDQGVYRIYGLFPGDYVVAALPTVGGVGPVEPRTAADYDEAVRALTPGAGRTGETDGPESPQMGGPARVGYAPIYYPGTPIAADAPPIHVNAGEVRDGVDIPIVMFGMSEISGTVIGANGQPTPAVQLSVTTVGPPIPSSLGAKPRLTPPDPQGRFTIANVPPGVYTLMARGGGVTVDAQGMTIRTADQTDWATAVVSAMGQDVRNVVLSLQPGLTFSGRVATAGTTAPDLRGTRVAVIIPDTDPSAARSAPVDAHGVFSVTGLYPGTYDVVVTLPPALSKQWAVRAVDAGGVDLRDQPLTFEGGSIGDVTIVLTDQRTEVAGTLSTASGAPTGDYFIVIFPDARALWHPNSPRVRVVRPAADGSFSARDLPVGAYRIAALTDVEGDEWRQSSFLESLIDTSVPIAVTEGTITRQDLRIR